MQRSWLFSPIPSCNAINNPMIIQLAIISIAAAKESQNNHFRPHLQFTGAMEQAPNQSASFACMYTSGFSVIRKVVRLHGLWAVHTRPNDFPGFDTSCNCSSQCTQWCPTYLLANNRHRRELMPQRRDDAALSSAVCLRLRVIGPATLT